MKNLNNKFFIFLKLNIISISIFFNTLILMDFIPGKKIKTQKNPQKELIKKNILNTISKIKNLRDNFDRSSNLSKELAIENLSPSAQERYKLENNYIEGNITVNNTELKNINKKDSKFILPFIKKNYFFIENFLATHNILKNTFQYYCALLSLNNYLIQGYTIKDSLNKIVKEIKSSSIHSDGFINFLYKLKTKNNLNDTYDNQMILLLNKILLYNGSDNIEVERAINRFYNNANRKPGILIIEQYEKNNFTIKENNNTYGELAPSKDIYQKLIYDKTKLETEIMRNRFQLLRRNISEEGPIKSSYYLTAPKIKNNIVEYFVITDESEKAITINKIEDVIKNLTKDFYYILYFIEEKELPFLLF